MLLQTESGKHMVNIIRTNAEHEDFVELVRFLDAELAQRDGKDHSFYAQFNAISKIKYAVVACKDDVPVGCGAIKEFDPGIMEVKRMYVRPEQRGKGVAAIILSSLEEWAAEMKCFRCVLETGKKQPEAIRLYERMGYRHIANYGQYVGVENSLCFAKDLDHG